MALEHAQPLETINLHAHGGPHAPPVSTSLLRTPHLQLLRLVLPAGHALPRHHVPGEITIQCIEGEADIATPARTFGLAAGTLVMLPAGEPHEVRSRTGCVLLVTVLNPAEAP